jgi:hypothetical protein
MYYSICNFQFSHGLVNFIGEPDIEMGLEDLMGRSKVLEELKVRASACEAWR